ncbi:MAG: cytochrome c [Chitinophagales bacterium]
MDEHKLRSIHNITLLALFIILILGGGFVWGEFKRASGIEKTQHAGMVVHEVSQPAYVTGANENGKTLFRKNCQRCHLVDKKMTGPALMNVKDRWADTTHIYSWIKNSQAYLETGDPYAKGLFNKYKSVMPAFPDLSDAEIAEILYYVDPEQ